MDDYISEIFRKICWYTLFVAGLMMFLIGIAYGLLSCGGVQPKEAEGAYTLALMSCADKAKSNTGSMTEVRACWQRVNAQWWIDAGSE